MASPISVLFSSVTQFSSVAQSCLTLCDPMDCNMPGLPVNHQLPELAQTHVHWVSDATQPFHPLSSPSPPTLIFPSIRIFSNESALCIKWPKYWSFSFNIFQSQTCLLFQVSLDFLLLHSNRLWWKRHLFLVLEGLVGLHRTIEGTKNTKKWLWYDLIPQVFGIMSERTFFLVTTWSEGFFLLERWNLHIKYDLYISSFSESKTKLDDGQK